MANCAYQDCERPALFGTDVCPEHTPHNTHIINNVGSKGTYCGRSSYDGNLNYRFSTDLSGISKQLLCEHCLFIHLNPKSVPTPNQLIAMWYDKELELHEFWKDVYLQEIRSSSSIGLLSYRTTARDSANLAVKHYREYLGLSVNTKDDSCKSEASTWPPPVLDDIGESELGIPTGGYTILYGNKSHIDGDNVIWKDSIYCVSGCHRSIPVELQTLVKNVASVVSVGYFTCGCGAHHMVAYNWKEDHVQEVRKIDKLPTMLRWYEIPR